METYHNLYLNARSRLMHLDERCAPLEARFIMIHASGKSHEELTRDYQMYASDRIRDDVDAMLMRRLDGEPLAYIIGSWEFYGISLMITPDVLIPRVDTEVLAGAAIEYAKQAGSNCRVLDLCTGSGCIGLAVAHNVRAAKVTMIDNSEAALKIAKQNARSLNLTVNFVLADALLPPVSLLGSFDIIVCNPPYIPTEVIKTLDVSVREHEPAAALDGGIDGLVFYRSVTRHWGRLLKPAGRLMFELGAGQCDEVKQICYLSGLAAFEVLNDTNGIERVLITSSAEI